MPIITNPFNGKLNLDVAEYRITDGDYIDALNITKDAQGRGQDRVVSNIVGNTLIPYTLPSGENKIIGFYPDKIRNRAYYFIWNSNGYNSIVYYNMDTETISKVLVSKTDSDGIDILSFNPSYKVLSVNIFYRDDEGDILFFNDGLNPPKSINILDNYGTSWKLEYLLIAKAPPIFPPLAVYENDTTVSTNNLRNALFQFCYRYVYKNNEKSVWSSKSIVPLPQQPTISLTENDFSNNARISLSFSTGGRDVVAIEIAFRETTSGLTSDWYLITSLSKANLSISNNVIETYKFKNDNIYSQIEVIEADQLQDFVPQKANASELANGNILLYSGITEGYNKTNMNLISQSSIAADDFFFDYCGLLFFASCQDKLSGVSGTTMKIYLFGTGINTGNVVTTLDNAKAKYIVNVNKASDGSNIGISYTNSSDTITVASLLTNILGAFTAVSGGGWSGSISGNILTLTNTNTFILLSSGTKYVTTAAIDNTVFANAWDSGYQYALQYFDAQGRTIGAQTSLNASVTTSSNDGNRFCQTFVNIYNRPPLEAVYYQLLRSNNTTYNKRLYWVSESAYSSVYVYGSGTGDGERFIYIGIGNIDTYNEQISSTKNVVSYSYAEGDRIRFIRRYNADNTPLAIPENYDYEIVGTESTIQYNITNPVPVAPNYNTYTATGNFLKIKYPTGDISSTFDFNGLADFQHYEVLLYNFTSNASATQRFFYEFGKCFAIGNPGTSNAYHIGLERTQTANLSAPATVSVTNGDLFYRKRKVPYDDKFNYLSNTIDIGTSGSLSSRYETLDITVPVTIDNTSYKIESQPNAEAFVGAGYPVFANPGYFFYNKSATVSKTLSIKGTLQMSSDGTSTFSMYAIVCNSLIPYAAKYTISLLNNEVNNITQNTPTEFVIDREFSIPPASKVWIVAKSTNDTIGSNNIIIAPFNFDFAVIKNTSIKIIESSFNDNYNLVTNSNGRPSVIDENAKRTYFPTLIRFGQAYQVNTNINGLNRFYYENFDEYDRSFGDVMRLHVRDRYLKVYQKFKVGNVPILTQIVKDVSGNPLQANTDQLINKIQYYAGDYGIGDASTSLAWNNFADYFVDDYRGVVCRLAQDGITPISILYQTNAFFVASLAAYRQELNNGIVPDGQVYKGNPCIYGVFDAYTNKYIIAMEEINRYSTDATTTTISPTTTTLSPPTTTTSTTAAPTTSTTTNNLPTTTLAPTTSTTTLPAGFCYSADRYECIGGSCTFVETININNPVELNIPRYYFDSVNGYVFKINELITCAGGHLITNMTGVGTLACNTLCPNETSTTTIAPTTTLPPGGCFNALVDVSPIDRSASDDGFVFFDFVDCGGTPRTISYDINKTAFNTGYCMDTNYTYNAYIFVGGTQTAATASSIYPGSSCITTTTTTAAPTTSTTTLATTSTTTTSAPLGYQIMNCQDGLDIYNVSMNPLSVIVVGDIFNTAKVGLTDKCWSVESVSEGPYDYSDVMETTIYADCISCAPGTTTTIAPTTTTAAPTTSTTTIPAGFCYTASRYECTAGVCSFVEVLNINNPVELNIPRYYFDTVNGYVFRIDELITCAGGHLITNMSGVGTVSCNTLCPQPTTTTLAPTTSTTTLAPTTSTTTVVPTTSTTTATPTTSTTTVQQIWYQILDCNDSSFAYSIQYPTGTFANSERCTATNIVTRTVIITGSTTTLPGGTLYTLTSQGALGCLATTTTLSPTTTTLSPTTTTAAPTTTTTTIPAGFCYSASRYECSGGVCSFVETLNINNPVELNIPRYYFDSVNGYVFRIDELITCAGGHLITNMSGVGTVSCNTLCPQPTTTTLSPTTTTLSPTTTTLSPTTTTLSPTTTTLSPTTTTIAPTTTVAPPSTALIYITNSSLDISVDYLKVNNVFTTSISGSYPATPGDSIIAETNQIGSSYTISISYVAYVTNQSITFIDANGISYCQGNNIGNDIIQFYNVSTSGPYDMYLNINDGLC